VQACGAAFVARLAAGMRVRVASPSSRRVSGGTAAPLVGTEATAIADVTASAAPPLISQQGFPT